MRLLGIALVALLAVPAGAQTLEVSVESREIYASMPFTLVLSARGFDEQPPPAAPELVIDGCRVTYIGITPSVSQKIQIVNGRRSDWREVTFVYRWQVTAPTAGRYAVPALTLSQGSKSAASPAVAFDAGDLEQTADMVVRMRLPQRPVWVGETFDGAVEWLLARDVESYDLVVPLFEIDAVRVEGAAVEGRTRSFRAGAHVIDLPMKQDRLREDGIDHTRISFPFRATATRAQTFDLDPVRVVARLESARERGFFDFGRARGALFQASGQRRQLVVRPLPESGRPHNFVNAVGGGFSIDVQASRTVVSVGDPIELTLRIRGDGELEGLSLPPLIGQGGLPPALFSVPAAAAVGSVDAQTNTKTFAVTARILSAEVREIPPIDFAYFDPNRGEYVSVSSRPVALWVAGVNVVGADDVTAAAVPAPTVAVDRESPRAVSSAVLIGADMSLSAANRALVPPWGSAIAPLPMVLLYLVPLALGVFRMWQMRTAARRGRRREIVRARREVERVLKSGGAAREMAPQALNAMRALARLTGHEGALVAPALEQLETSAFDPAAAAEPLDREIVVAVRALAREWEGGGWGGNRRAVSSATAVLCMAFGAAAALSAGAGVMPASPETHARVASGELGSTMQRAIERARQVYSRALEEQDPVRRARHFADAERYLREAAAMRSTPELLADWGNAALGAGDSGRATLAFRRALAAQPNHERAAKNLAWLRDRAPAWLPRPARGGALDSLLFWRELFSVAQRYWIAAGAFALAVLLLTPWSTRRVRLLRRLSVVPIAVWAVAVGSGLLSRSAPPEGVVVIDGAPLRSADSTGARLAFAHPLPAGAEVTILETRDGWLRVALADGTRGWIMANSVAPVQPQTDSRARVSAEK